MLAIGKKINFSLTPSERYNLYSGKRKNAEDALEQWKIREENSWVRIKKEENREADLSFSKSQDRYDYEKQDAFLPKSYNSMNKI